MHIQCFHEKLKTSHAGCATHPDQSYLSDHVTCYQPTYQPTPFNPSAPLNWNFSSLTFLKEALNITSTHRLIPVHIHTHVFEIMYIPYEDPKQEHFNKMDTLQWDLLKQVTFVLYKDKWLSHVLFFLSFFFNSNRIIYLILKRMFEIHSKHFPSVLSPVSKVYSLKDSSHFKNSRSARMQLI